MKRTIVLIGMALVFCALAANGALITIEIEAVVDNVWDGGYYLEGKIGPGDTIRGTYSYNSDMPDSATEPWLGEYEYSQHPYGMILGVGDFRFETAPEDVDFIIYVSNDRLSPKGDIYNIVSKSNLPLSNGTPVESIWWQLNDNTGSALSSDALPTTFPFLNDWEGNVLGIDAYRRYGISAHVTSAIPEPCTIILLGLGGLVLRKRS
jgi:hypothetical protein